MLLTVDIGNTEIKAGGFESDGGEPAFVLRMASDIRLTGAQYAAALHALFALYGVRAPDITGAIVSSVVPALTPALCEALALLCGCKVLTVGPGIKTGLNIKVDNPVAMGTDFVCAAVGALMCAAPPALVFDFGTATTVTVLDEGGALTGRSIVCGAQTALDALGERTACLPSIRVPSPDGAARGRAPLFGRNTVQAMEAGALYAAAALVDGLMRRCTEGTACLLTGGLARTIAPYCLCEARVEPHLILHGLRQIYLRNT